MPDENTSLIDAFIEDQQRLTAVERFSRQHERDELTLPVRRYRDLLPATPPAPGEQYAFEVELDKCSGCKACVTACHSLNGLDDNETWREVGLLIPKPQRRGWDGRLAAPKVGGTSSTSPSMQHVTTACHHCVDPACLNGCPVLAYEKDSVTGIVRHLDDQCIGCQYCVLKCPYDVPKYNSRLGIVRKCDMCSSRLAANEAPACVQACPNEAIRITKVRTDGVTIEFRDLGNSFLSGAPSGDYTLPTTRYVGTTANNLDAVGRGVSTAPRFESESRLGGSFISPRRGEDSAPYLVAADEQQLKSQPAHWPLVLMLVLSQAAVGVTCAAASGSKNHWLLLTALALAAASITASVFHLGRPLGAWRFFLGLRRSWLSREILVFGMFLPLLAVSAWSAIGTPPFDPPWFSNLVRAGSGIGAPLLGLLGVFCSMMIYHDTRRVLWHARRSAALFFGTAALFAAVAMFAVNGFSGTSLAILTLVVMAKLAVEASVLRHVVDREFTSLQKTARLIAECFQPFAFVRVVCVLLGGIGLPLLLHAGVFGGISFVVAWCSCALLLMGELIERMLFFRTVDAPKMPGGAAP